MFQKYLYLLLFFSIINSCAQDKNEFTFYSSEKKIVPRISIPLNADAETTLAAGEFVKNFKLLTQETLVVERSNGLNQNYTYVVLSVNPTQKDNYCIYKKEKNIIIQGSSNENLGFAIQEFFKKFTLLSFPEKINQSLQNEIQTEVMIPNELSICSTPDFEYREPYFSPNFDAEFRIWNKTNYLELEWGLWGHNLPKLIKGAQLPETIFAEVDKERNEEQFCFTSEIFFEFVNDKIKDIHENDAVLKKFMILPNDNEMVCTCSTCKAVGNTTKDAAPAVFTFMNKLAKNHPKLLFFTAAYNSVKEVPKFKASENLGVFYSTINIQKGIPIERTKNFEKFESDIKKWKNYINNVYVWDYGVNFDNYFGLYPSLKVNQDNFKLYKKLGVNGVFMHGSEYNYSTLEDMKTTIIANLLWDTSINLDAEINKYFTSKYPPKLADILTNYYLFTESSFYTSKKELGIYSGINKSVRKYLDPKVFFSFYKEFDTHTQNNKYDKDFLKLATAFTFLKLEIMRDAGFSEYGFASLNGNDEIIVKNEIGTLLDKLLIYSKSADIKTYNEVKYTLEDYINSWKQTIFRYHKRKHYFYKKSFKVLSNLDEDYQNFKILNDGTFGLRDYNTNWHLTSTDNLILEIEKSSISKAKKITFSFLQDKKHKIYYPSFIEIVDMNNKLLKKISVPTSEDVLNTKEISIDLPSDYDKLPLPEYFKIVIKRAEISGKNALACDEVIFN
ncbi:DUF4838 domain-containing protein [Polaribacter gangjinensis]|uniref:DUF4838 domain-containing protein n=1 Tax=Polaribacter gangjinensis TaxID=574710 RepID=UPI000CF51C32|nr:DUF4838 domain-containing protein [Polaribacter gangjinensis]